MPELDEPEDQVVRSKRLRRTKLTRLVAIASSSVLLACAGCCFLLGLIFRAQIFENPADVNQVAAKITDWTLPEGFQGKLGVTVDVGLVRTEIAKFQQREGRGMLIIRQWQPAIPELTSFAFAASEGQMKQYVPEIRTIKIDKPQFKSLTIRGWHGEFEFGHGEDLASNSRYQQISGRFRGKAGDVALIFQCEEGILDDDAMEAFLASIK